MAAILALDQLTSYTHARPGLANTAFEDKSHAKFLANLLHLYRFTFVGECSVTRDHEQPGNVGQICDNVLGDPIAEVLLLRVAAHVVERQNGDGRALVFSEIVSAVIG